MELLDEANLLLKRGDLEGAAGSCREILNSATNRSRALQIVEAICEKWVACGRYDQAVACLELMLTHLPDSAQVNFNLAAALIRMGYHRRAIDALRNVIRLRSQWLEAHYYLAVSLEEVGEFAAAESQWRRVLKLKPDDGSALFRLAGVLSRLGDLAGAQECFARARCAPTTPLLCNDLGLRSMNEGRIDEAIEDLKRATVLDPKFAAGWMNLGIALLKAGRVDEAVISCEISITLEPGRAEGHWNYAATLLSKGDYDKGWREYEWRWRCPEFASKARKIDRPAWQGEDIRGQHILLHDEQGFGDTIQFIRYAPLLAERGASVVLLCQKPLQRLLSRVAGVKHAISDGEPCPHVDVHAPIASLPLLFKTELQTIPSDVPYLSTDPALSDLWAKKLSHRNGRIRVGLAWHGNSKPNPDRSIPAEFLKPLLGVNGAVFHSLQKENVGISAPRPGEEPIHDFSQQIDNFSDTAALISKMELVISIDTAVAHLSCAMGKSTWIMLPYSADWRWLLGRDDSPWYPTARLFRQSSPGDWSGVIQRVVKELQRFIFDERAKLRAL